MNFRAVAKLLSYVALLIGGTMVFSLPWAHPALGHRTAEESIGFEVAGFFALVGSIVVSLAVGGALWFFSRHDRGQLYRKEALAVVGLSWVMATVLGALPFYFSGTYRSATLRLEAGRPPQVGRRLKSPLTDEDFRVVQALLNARAKGLSERALIEASEQPDAAARLRQLAQSDRDWKWALLFPEADAPPQDRRGNFRVRWLRMTPVDAVFESQSGFSTTGATVIADLEDPLLVPHCVLFWRSSTHFLGGLGIIVLFVAILGQGSAGKAMMRAEMPGPSKEGAHSRMQHTAWVFAAIYCALNGVQAVLLWLFGLTWFDALCHAFGTMATGGFSTYNASVGHFNSLGIDVVIIVFMILAGMNFTLLYYLLVGQPGKMLADVEWRTYMSILFGVTALVVGFGLWHGDFVGDRLAQLPWTAQMSAAIRYGMFQVVSIMTTTGYGTHDFDNWNHFARGMLFLLMFVGGCAGSTGGGLKVIRHILFLKILFLEIEHAFHPSVVRPLRLGGRPIEDVQLRNNILVYFGLILVIFVFSWMFLVAVEPGSTWGPSEGRLQHKLIDSATAIAATLNNIGPGLGIIGASQNYAHFSSLAKLLFTWLMIIGRLEVYAMLVLFVPAFWRNR